VTSIVRQTDRPALLYGSVQWATRGHVEDREALNITGQTYESEVLAHIDSHTLHTDKQRSNTQTKQQAQHTDQTTSTTPPLRQLQQIQGGRRRALLAEEALLSQTARDTRLSLCSGWQVE
jgi:hypothetical protein